MTEKSSSLRPYNVTRRSDLFYTFITDSGILYTAYFVCCDSYDDKLKNSYMFNFEHTEYIGQKRHDSRIKATIALIIEEFFNYQENSMIYVCDSVDGRQKARKKLFDKWHQEHGSDLIIKEEFNVSGEDYDLYSSLFLRTDNPNKENIIKAFKELMPNLAS